MLKDKIKLAFDLKGQYKSNQDSFNDEMRSKFPSLFVEMNEVLDKLEYEICVLLCSTVIFKSARIPVPAYSQYNYSNTSSISDAFLTRKLGMRFAHSSDKDLSMLQTKYTINTKGDVEGKADKRRKHPDIELSVLKSMPKQIDQNQFDIFMKMYRETLQFAKSIKDYSQISSGYSPISNGPGRIIKSDMSNIRFSIRFEQEGFIFLPNGVETTTTTGGDYKGQELVSVHDLFHYGESGYGHTSNGKATESFSKTGHASLKIINENSEEFIGIVIKGAREKADLLSQAKKLIEVLESHTVPFLIINKLLANENGYDKQFKLGL